MARKMAIVGFKGEMMCFAHALMNALDMHEKGFEVKLIIEGAACGTIGELAQEGKPFANLYEKARRAGLIDGICKACANQMGTLDEARRQQLPLLDEMLGHPSLGRYAADGYEVIVF
jgi:hypothetical protein